eukprot:105167-Prorocentrum_minimum.AAC.1
MEAFAEEEEEEEEAKGEAMGALAEEEEEEPKPEPAPRPEPEVAAKAAATPLRRSYEEDDNEAATKSLLKSLHSSARWCVGSLIAPTAGLLALECVERATAFLGKLHEVETLLTTQPDLVNMA